MVSIVTVPYWLQHSLLLANDGMLSSFCVIDSSFNKLINQLQFNLFVVWGWHSQCSTTVKESDRCKGQCCQPCWSVLLLHWTTLSLIHGDQFSFFDILAILALGDVHIMRHTHCARYRQRTCHLWYTQCTCLWQHTWLWRCTHCLQFACTPSLVYSLYSTLACLCCWSSHCKVRSPSHLANNNMNFDCCVGVCLIFPCLRLLLSLLLTIWQ